MVSEKKMILIRRKISILLTFALASLLFAGIFPVKNCIASENVIYVDDSNLEGPWNGTQDYPYRYIQDGIDNASEGDIIYIYSGTYNENLEITKTLSLIGQDKTTVNINGAADNKHAVKISGTSVSYLDFVNISGLTIRNVEGLSSGWDGIYAEYVTNCIITDCIIKDSDDGVKLNKFRYSTISENIIENNIAIGLYLVVAENNEIKNNVIENNLKGIHLYSSSNNNEIFGNTITRNSRYGIHILQSTNNIIHHNHLTNNGENAQDQDTNSWSYSNQGNYWDDYDGVDINPQDGIGDIPYYIPSEDNQDEYPLGYFGPTAHIVSIIPNPAIQGETVSFNGDGIDIDGDIVAWEWKSDKEDEVLSNSEDFFSSTLSVGTHAIKFRVKDSEGRWSPYDQEILTINPQSYQNNQKPIATIDNITPNPAIREEEIYFKGHGTDEEGGITAWKWTSSIDGEISNQQEFNISDLSVGIHTITFQVMDDDYTWSEESKATLIVQNSSLPFLKPIANAGGPYTGQVNKEITFDGSSSSSDENLNVVYQWDGDDNLTGAGVSITHIYSEPGNYTINLTITDDAGENSTDMTYVIISESSGHNSDGEGDPGFQIALPFPVIVGISLLIIGVVIGLFIYWMKRE